MTREDHIKEVVDDTVGWFSNEIKKRLLDPKNVKKGIWHGCTNQYLLNRIEDEIFELKAAMSSSEGNHGAIMHECADIAAFCMMLADVSSLKTER